MTKSSHTLNTRRWLVSFLLVLGNEGSELGLIRSGELSDLGPSLVKVECRHGLDGAVGGDLFSIVDIDLDGFDFRVFGS